MTDNNTVAAELLDTLCDNARLSYSRELDDFSHGEMSILSHLCYCENGVCAGVLCETLGMTTPRISAAIAGLKKKGLVFGRTDPEDRRKIHIYITDEGRTLVNDRRCELRGRIGDIIEILGEDDAREYIRITSRINRIFADSKASSKGGTL